MSEIYGGKAEVDSDAIDGNRIQFRPSVDLDDQLMRLQLVTVVMAQFAAMFEAEGNHIAGLTGIPADARCFAARGRKDGVRQQTRRFRLEFQRAARGVVQGERNER